MISTLGIFAIIVLILSVVIHEYLHGWAADQLGDPTARMAGRLTLNPIAHIDLWGSIILPVFLFLASGGTMTLGYAKPVPYNPLNLRNPQKDSVKVAAAGPLSNLVLAVFFGLLLRFAPLDPASFLFAAFQMIVATNLVLFVFNMLPIPPLDGSGITFPYLPDSLKKVYYRLEGFGILIAILVVYYAFPIIARIVDFLFRLIVG